MVPLTGSRCAAGSDASRSGNAGDQAFQRFVYYGTILLFLIDTIEGALRFALLSVGTEFLIYLKDVFVLIAVLWVLCTGLLRRSLNKPFAVLLTILAVWSIVGFRVVGNIGQALLGLKLFLPITLGMIAAPALFARKTQTVRFMVVLWIVSVVGLVSSALFPMPWSGLSYQVGDVQMQVARKWGLDGVERLAGFSRSSISVAFQVFIFALFVLCFSNNRSVRVGVWVLSAPVLVLTTQRGIMIGYLVVTGFHAARTFFPSLRRVWRLILPLTAVLMVALPLIPAGCFKFLALSNLPGIGKVTSFFDRAEDEWPEAFRLLRIKGSMIFGRGIGGIGTAQSIFEPEFQNPADNFFLYLFVTFGVSSIVLIGFITIRCFLQDVKKNRESLYVFSGGLAVFAIGTLMNCVENVPASITIGTLLARISIRSRNPFPQSAPIPECH